MTKNDFMDIARACGVPQEILKSYRMASIERLYDAILERAAIECDAMTRMKASEHEDLRDACAAAIRAIKITQ